MKPLVALSLALAMGIGVLSPRAFAEIKVGRNTVSVSLDSRQTLASNDSPLNPDNEFGAEDGYYGSEVYAVGYSFVGDWLSLRFNDFGSLDADDNPDGENCFGELYGTIRIGGAFLDVGKKRINQSLSYFKSPINFVLDDYGEYELRYSEGRIMANLDAFTDYGFFGISYLPKVVFDSQVERYASSSQGQQGLLRYDVTVRDWAVGLAISRDSCWRVGMHASRSVGECAEIHVEGVFNEERERREISADGPLTEEKIVVVRNRLESLIGLTLNLSFLSGIVEYYYNQAGYDHREWDEVTDAYRGYAASDEENPLYLYNLGMSYRTLARNRDFNGRHYLMLRISNPSTENYEVAMNAVVNLQDRGVILMPSIGYSGWSNLSIEAKFAKLFGPTYSEFSLHGNDWSCGLSVELWL